KIAEHVYLVSTTLLTGDQILIDKLKDAPNLTISLEHEVVVIEGSSRVEAIRIRDSKSGEERKIDVGAVFVEIGLIPNSEFAKGITKLNEFGEIEVNCACETGISGLFAAGDVTNVPEKQIVVAAGEGAKAALNAHRYLQRL
ncbi:MAG: FAD-dependent oxidoreductase, partial [Dehalococcoidia bacterium]|nr:FAD-dependent oxidoreductase [Dehalococcoidia bacterium]